MPSKENLVKRLRDHIVGEVHIGHVAAGERLPTYRELGREWGVDHRAVAKAYQILEREGLVEIRERQGVFLKEQERIGGRMPSDTARWMADEVLLEAWRRRIKIPELPEFVRRCTASVQLQCACVESTEDHRWLLSHELSEWFGFRSHRIPVENLPVENVADGVHVLDLDDIPMELREVELLVTTSYHAAPLRALAEALDKPFVIVRMHPAAVETVERHLREHDLTVICVDPRMGERVRIFAGEALQGRVRVVQVDDVSALAEIDEAEPVLASHAVAERAGRSFNYLVDPRTPAFDSDSAREIIRVLIRLNLEAVENG